MRVIEITQDEFDEVQAKTDPELIHKFHNDGGCPTWSIAEFDEDDNLIAYYLKRADSKEIGCKFTYTKEID